MGRAGPTAGVRLHLSPRAARIYRGDVTATHGSRVVRSLYFGTGLVCLAIGVVGVVLPIVPTTFPILVAAYCFARSSERFDRWLTHHRVFGPIVRDWRAGVGFTRQAKALAVAGILGSVAFSATFFVPAPAWRIVLAGTAIVLSGYVLSLPTKPSGVDGVSPRAPSDRASDS